MATVAVQTVSRAGTTGAYASASGGGDKFEPGRDVFLHVKNGSGSSITATVVSSAELDGLAVADVAVAVPAGAERFIGPFPGHLFEDATDGLVHVTWSATTTVTFAVISTR